MLYTALHYKRPRSRAAPCDAVVAVSESTMSSYYLSRPETAESSVELEKRWEIRTHQRSLGEVEYFKKLLQDALPEIGLLTLASQSSHSSAAFARSSLLILQVDAPWFC